MIIVSPAPRGSTLGNSVTADRYLGIFRSLGWRTRILEAYTGEPAQCLVALHARKSARSVLAFRKRYPDRQIVLVLTGTDLYRDMHTSALAVRAMNAADALVTLQPEGARELPPALRAKTTAIVQSAPAGRPARRGARATFDICVLGHLRWEKDPMRAAYALRTLDGALPIRLRQAGGILAPQYGGAVERETRRNPRYRFLGELSRAGARRLLLRSDLLVHSSRLEGGANVLCEAIACGVPILASRIPGNTGILGRTYPGLYPAGDTAALARLIERASVVPAYYERLQKACAKLKPLVAAAGETKRWRLILR
ncbi:MAG TPA: selenoneine biosynthesis selenosugar synthase SenB [Candidatus Baltobacteraceae bacterium]|jgi:putative glycosyltransferase (TIGR04348 family)